MHTSAIYKIENLVNGKVYIGQTAWLEKRKSAHISKLRNGNHGNIHLQRAYNKYGEDAFKLSIVEYCEPSKLDDREMYWIKFYDSFNNGYNQTLGGNGNRGYHMSEAARKKLQSLHRDCSGEKNPMYGKKLRDYMSAEAYEAMCLSRRKPNLKRRGIPMSDEQKKHLSDFRKEYYKTHEHPKKGIKLSDEQIKRTIETKAKNGTLSMPLGTNPHAKPIICVNTGQRYSCIKEAALSTDANATSISECANHYVGRLSAGENKDGDRLVWAFPDEYDCMSDAERQMAIERAQNPSLGGKNINAKTVYCITTGEVFDSVCDAARKYKIDNSSISKKCRAGGGFCGTLDGERLYWQYQQPST